MLEYQKQRRQQLDRMSNSSNRSSRSSRNSSSSGRIISSSNNSRKANYLPGLLIVLLVLLQNFELHMCRQLMRHSAKTLLKDTSNSNDNDNDNNNNSDNDNIQAVQKRSVAESSVGQPEEIFSAPNDATDMNYDEYPMVVPKRAALLLDRLMVALHHALENEQYGHRIGEFYANKNLMQVKPTELMTGNEQLQPTEEGISFPSNSHNFHMYSDDDPGVLMDYDFKDLNQINRATGETLMAKSFQRRAGGINTKLLLGNMDVATTNAAGAGANPGAGAGASAGAGGITAGISGGSSRRIHHTANGGGRMYWRCYFNAVSCF